MKINRIDHISVAVRNLKQARETWEPVLGKPGPDHTYVDEREKIRVARYWLGETAFELMESTAPDGDVARYIEKHGEGVMVVSLNVDRTREAVDELAAKGYPFIPDSTGQVARPFKDREFAFIHPRNMTGVLTELIDDNPRRPKGP
ncbi:MAG: methylmalonyl-CoA epimerase [Desulfococcus sp. 4484_242]|nr:MAG: methylmalonyl-CoA epimerase [Desulfococcus sp. 4484_242]